MGGLLVGRIGLVPHRPVAIIGGLGVGAGGGSAGLLPLIFSIIGTVSLLLGSVVLLLHGPELDLQALLLLLKCISRVTLAPLFPLSGILANLALTFAFAFLALCAFGRLVVGLGGWPTAPVTASLAFAPLAVTPLILAFLAFAGIEEQVGGVLLLLHLRRLVVVVTIIVLDDVLDGLV